jgi:hypothetical protein
VESGNHALDELASQLQSNPSSTNIATGSSESGYGSGDNSSPEKQDKEMSLATSRSTDGQNGQAESINLELSQSSCSRRPQSPQSSKFLQLCVNTRGPYITLEELDVGSSSISDAQVFQMIKEAYFKCRGFRSRFAFLIKPVTVEFVRFTMWSKRSGFVWICARPQSMPSVDDRGWEYSPCPLDWLPPMPPTVFIHYLEHGDSDLNPLRNTWVPRLPKKVNGKTAICDDGTCGWGIHIIEGPNRIAVFWTILLTVLAGIVTFIVWSQVRHDQQGGAGIGALIVALPSVILTAFLFRLDRA